MRIGLDGFNLAIPDGTGVATYGASLAKVLMKSGHCVEGIFGIDPGKASDTYESLFFERFGQGDKRALSRKRIARAFIGSPWSGPNLTQVPLTDHVDRRSFGTRWPDFSALWTSPLLFELAAARFLTFGRITQISVPNPPPGHALDIPCSGPNGRQPKYLYAARSGAAEAAAHDARQQGLLSQTDQGDSEAGRSYCDCIRSQSQ